jgi:hypothetical protein
MMFLATIRSRAWSRRLPALCLRSFNRVRAKGPINSSGEDISNLLRQESALLTAFVNANQTSIRHHKQRLLELADQKAAVGASATSARVPEETMVVGDRMYFSNDTRTKIFRKSTVDDANQAAAECIISLKELGKNVSRANSIHNTVISNCHKYVAMDVRDGKDRSMLVVKNLETHSLFDLRCTLSHSTAQERMPVRAIIKSFEFGSIIDSGTVAVPLLYLLVEDSVGRPSMIYSVLLDAVAATSVHGKGVMVLPFLLDRAAPGSNQTERSKLLFAERQPEYFTGMRLSRDRTVLFIFSESKTSSEVCMISTVLQTAGSVVSKQASLDACSLQVLCPRQQGLVNRVDCCGDVLLVAEKDTRLPNLLPDNQSFWLSSDRGNNKLFVTSKGSLEDKLCTNVLRDLRPIEWPSDADKKPLVGGEVGGQLPLNRLLEYLSSDFIIQDFELYESSICVLGRRNSVPSMYLVKIARTAETVDGNGQETKVTATEIDIRAALAASELSVPHVLNAYDAGAVALALGSGGSYKDSSLKFSMSSNLFVEGSFQRSRCMDLLTRCHFIYRDLFQSRPLNW